MDGCWQRFTRRCTAGIQKHWHLLLALLLGQFLSVLLCGTGVTSQLLEQDHSVAVPTTQAFFNYALLAAVFGVALATSKNFLTILKQNWWKYAILGVIDVEANYLLLLGYKYTSLTSIQLLDSFTIASVMILSFIFLRVRYKLINFMGILLSMIGIVSLVLADTSHPCSRAKATNPLIGDLLCLGGTVLYAISNVAQEFLVKNHSIVEYLGLLGVAGSVASAIQLLLLERTTIVKIEWTTDIGLLFGGFVLCLFIFYSTMPYVMKYSSAVVVNLSLLTADVYTLFFGLFLFHCRFSLFYILSFILVVIGVLIYNMKTPGTSHRRARDHARSLLTLSHSHRRSHRAKESEARGEIPDVSDLEGTQEGEELLGSETMKVTPKSRYGSTAIPCGSGVKGAMYERLVESYTSSDFDSKSGPTSVKSRASTCSGVLTYGSISEVTADVHGGDDGGVLTYGSVPEVTADVHGGDDGGVLTYGSISEVPADVHGGDDGGVLTYGSISEVTADVHGGDDDGVLTYGSISEVPADDHGGDDGGVLTYGSISEVPAEGHRRDGGVLTYGSLPAKLQGSDGGVLTYGSVSEVPAKLQGSDGGVLTYGSVSEVPAKLQGSDGGVDKDFQNVEERAQESSENRTK